MANETNETHLALAALAELSRGEETELALYDLRMLALRFASETEPCVGEIVEISIPLPMKRKALF
jgi:hypothetical protein